MAEESTTRRRLITVAALLGLIAVQTLVAIIYKLAQKNGKYQFSTASALTMAEFIKIWLSFGLLVKATGWKEARSEMLSNMKKAPYIQLILLALSYFVNNHLNFYLFLWADPVSITVMKSGASFITAILSWIVLSKLISKVQWSSILLQVAGLCLLQYDPCRNSTTLQLSGYFVMFISVTIASANGIWNERLLKSYDCSLHVQNMILYMAGTVFNFTLFLANSSKIGFFEGYDFPAIVIVFLNAVIGLTITVIYKYTNAIAKTFCSAVATVVLFIVNATLFNVPATLNSVLSCVVVFVATYLYTQGAIVAPSTDSTSSESSNGKGYDKLPVSEMDVEEETGRGKSPLARLMAQISARRIGAIIFTAVIIASLVISTQSIVTGVEESASNESVPQVDVEEPATPHSVKSAELRVEDLDGMTLPPSRHFFDDILVILHFNNPRYNHLPLLLEQYGKVFKNFVVCGPNPHPMVDIVCEKGAGGHIMYGCIADIMEAYPNHAGYMSFHFDLLVNYWTFSALDKNQTWITYTQDNEGPYSISMFPDDSVRPSEWYWWGTEWGLKACRSLMKELPRQYKDKMNASLDYNDPIWRGMGDLFYVPQRMRTEFIQLARLFMKHKVFLELAIPTIPILLEAPSRPVNLTGFFDWNSRQFEEFWKPTYQFAHPFRLHETGMYDKFRAIMSTGYRTQ